MEITNNNFFGPIDPLVHKYFKRVTEWTCPFIHELPLYRKKFQKIYICIYSTEFLGFSQVWGFEALTLVVYYLTIKKLNTSFFILNIIIYIDSAISKISPDKQKANILQLYVLKKKQLLDE